MQNVDSGWSVLDVRDVMEENESSVELTDRQCEDILYDVLNNAKVIDLVFDLISDKIEKIAEREASFNGN